MVLRCNHGILAITFVAVVMFGDRALVPSEPMEVVYVHGFLAKSLDALETRRSRRDRFNLSMIQRGL